MMRSLKIMTWLLLIIIGFEKTTASDEESMRSAEQVEKSSSFNYSLQVFKSPTCGCCQRWIDHINEGNIATSITNTEKMSKIKSENKILTHYQSCHTAISLTGFIFEGHIPATTIRRFLDNPPNDAFGLAVTGMPIGSPGMEMGGRHDDYEVLLLKRDGSSAVYEKIIGHTH